MGHRINQRGNEIHGDNDWKSRGHIKSSFKIEVYSNTILPEETTVLVFYFYLGFVKNCSSHCY